MATVSTIIGGIAAGASIYQSKKSADAAETAAKQERERIQKEKKKALKRRKNIIDRQRSQLGVGKGYNTNPTGLTGLDTNQTSNVNEGLLG
jgi:hypothetical protein